MLTALQLITQALQDAKAPGFTNQGLNKLNIILDEICLTEDFALARGVYFFNLNPSLITTVAGFTNFGGPYPLPLDFLRTSGSSGSDGHQYSFFYTFNGVPYPLDPIDLGRLDMQVQQAGQQSLPFMYATDISPESTAQDRMAAITTAATTSGQPAITVTSASNLLVGMGCAGLGIAAGSVVTNINGTTITLSLNATGTFANASVMFGTPPNASVWPGPSGSFPTTLRYQRLMPPIVDTSRVPWFPDQNYLLVRLTADLMSTTDDARRQTELANAQKILGKYKVMADDKTNRAETVQLDRNRFGPRFANLRNTKQVGWAILICAILPFLSLTGVI